jgi:hypothetical protein
MSFEVMEALSLNPNAKQLVDGYVNIISLVVIKVALPISTFRASTPNGESLLSETLLLVIVSSWVRVHSFHRTTAAA